MREGQLLDGFPLHLLPPTAAARLQRQVDGSSGHFARLTQGVLHSD